MGYGVEPGAKVALVGAGSASFGLPALVGLLRDGGIREGRLRDLDLRLVDTDLEAVTAMAEAGRRLAAAWGSDARITASTERREALREADVVAIAVAVDREGAWARDREIARRRGVEHYAENGGPGGMAHTARSVAAVLPIARDVARLAPDALVVVFTNPLPRVCLAVARETGLRVVGLCHQIRFGYHLAGIALADRLGLEALVPPGYAFRWTDAAVEVEDRLAAAAIERLSIRAAGLNHFTWMQEVRDRRTGEDLLPLLRGRLGGAGGDPEHLAARFPDLEPLTRALVRATGAVPVSGDTHLSEYLPFTRTPESWARFAIQPYDHEWSERRRQRARALVRRLAAGEEDPDSVRDLTGEGLDELLTALAAPVPVPLEAVNVPNRGFLPGVPDGAFVEVPATAWKDGLHPTRVAPLPEPVAEWCRREARIADLVVEGLRRRDPDRLREALLLDPAVGDLDLADALLADYRAATAELP